MLAGEEQRRKPNRRIKGLIHEPKLTWSEVNEIRRQYVHQSRTQGLKALAAQYSVSVNNIHKIVRGKTWRVTEGDGNVAPPLADKVTAQAFAKALGQYGQSMAALRAELNRLVQA
jgi:hypothetical protein